MLTRATPRGLPLTELGMGASQLGNLYTEMPVRDVVDTCNSAWNAGIRYFDTAPHYGLGLSERRLGEQLRSRPRDEYIISSKVGRILVPSPETAHLRDDEGFDVPRDVKRVFDFSRDGILRSVEQSLKRTGLDRFDILYLHDPEDHLEQASTEAAQALIELRDQGVVSAIGAGSKYSAPLAELIRRADLDLVMVAGRFTLIDHSGLGDVMSAALENNVGVVIAGVYNSGLLGRDRPKEGAYFDYEPASREMIARAHRIADVCERHGVTLPQAALAFPFLHPAVVSIVLGARNTSQMNENIARYQAAVPPDLWSELRSLHLIPALPSISEKERNQ